MKKLPLLFIILAAAFTVACTNDSTDESSVIPPDQTPEHPTDPDEPTPPEVRTLSFANITDAEVLYLTTRKNDTARTEDEKQEPANTLFKISYDGETEEVVFTDENGQPVEGVNVTAFRQMSDKYIYMSFDLVTDYESIPVGETTTEDPESGQLTTQIEYEYRPIYKHMQAVIQKSDGAAFKIDPIQLGGDEWTDIISERTEFQTDYNGNVYFIPQYSYNIYKIYTHGHEVYINQINRSDMTPAINTNYFTEWLVDRRGNVLINDQFLRLVSGEFATYEQIEYWSSNPNIFYAWNDSEGFYNMQLPAPNPTETGSYKTDFVLYYCRPESPKTTWEQQKVLSLDGYISNLTNNPFKVFICENKTILFHIQEEYIPGIKITVNDRDNITIEQLTQYTYPAGIEFKNYCKERYPYQEQYLYGMSSSEIWRLEIETGRPELLYKYDDEFVIKSMSVKDGIVTFFAFELRKGNDVVAEIYPDKTVKVLESTNGDQIIYLERIN